MAEGTAYRIFQRIKRKKVNEMNYKDIFYRKYVSTHVLPRKGKNTINEFKQRSITYQKQFGKFLPKDKSSNIIDVGCGNGSVTWWLQQIGFTNASGTDISAEQVDIGKELGVNNIEQSDIKIFSQNKSNFYDVIIARDILEHFNKEDIIEILTYCNNYLKIGGVIIIQVPNAESPFFGRIRYGDFTHDIAFTSSSLSQLLMVVGFSNVRFFPMRPCVYGVKSIVRYTLWRFIECFYKLFLFSEIGRGKYIVTQNIIAVANKKDDSVKPK